MNPNNTNENQNTTEKNVDTQQPIQPPQLTQNGQPLNTKKQVDYMSVFKKPVVIMVTVFSVVLFLFGLTQSNADTRTFLSIPLFALVPIVVGVAIIQQAKK